ncbi:MAG: hypothetical protein EAX86_07075 [Candidatus Heimdallarchaeota archaeon]|nr:hypothetical protein [Candidatus Heimdallarchaeota archaeon]
MESIEAYLNQVKVEIIKLKGDLRLLEDLRTNLFEEWSDFKLEYSDIPEKELKLQFITNLESPEEIAKSLIGKYKLIELKDGFTVVRKLKKVFAAYNRKIMSTLLGVLMTYFALWTIPAIMYFVSKEGYNVIRLIPDDMPFRELPYIFLRIIDSVTDLFIFNEVSFFLYTVFNPLMNFWVFYRFPLTLVLCFLLFTGYLYRSIDSIKRLFLIILVSAFSFIFSLFFITFLIKDYHNPYQYGSNTLSLLWGYSVLLGSLIIMSLFILILLVLYDTLKEYPVYNDYSVLVHLVKNQESPYFTALVTIILTISPRIIFIFHSPNFLWLYEIPISLFILISATVYILRKTNLMFSIKVLFFQMIILIPIWFFLPLNFGIIVSMILIGSIIYELRVNDDV